MRAGMGGRWRAGGGSKGGEMPKKMTRRKLMN